MNRLVYFVLIFALMLLGIAAYQAQNWIVFGVVLVTGVAVFAARIWRVIEESDG